MDGRLRAGVLALLAVWLLGGCREASRARPPPPAPPQGSVNPDAGVTSYACADGQTITAGYPDASTAVVTYKNHAYTLKLGPSASGARYVGYGLQWWTKGVEATLAPLKSGETVASGAGVTCKEAGDRDATKI